MSLIASDPYPIIKSHAKRWTTAEYDTLLTCGLLREGSKTYLWDGEIVEPMPENQPHVNAQDNLSDELRDRLPRDQWTVSPSHPLALRDGYKPQPDLMVLSGPRSNYRHLPPNPADVALLVEVTDSTYAEDAGEKLPAYAAADIPVYWIVHIAARRVEVYSRPEVVSGVGRYLERADYSLDASVPLVLNSADRLHDFGEIAVAGILRDSLAESPNAQG